MSSKVRAKRKLLDRLSGDSALWRAACEVTSGANPESAGPDGVTIESFRASFKSQIRTIQNELRSGTFVSGRGRGVAIITPSIDGVGGEKVRPITVFSIRDRVVHRAVANLIWPRLRPHVDSDVSFGGIRSWRVKRAERTTASAKKNVRAAAARICTCERGKHFTFETDIQRFFPSIDKSCLLSRLEKALCDDSLLTILAAAIDTAVTNSSELEARGLSEHWDSMRGVPQGGVLSPLLANFYLVPFDAAMCKSGFALIRYVDDLVIPAETEAEAIAAHDLAKEKLQELQLAIHPLNEADGRGRVKTRIVKPGESFSFLGLRFNKHSIHPAAEKVTDLKARLREITHARLGARTLVEAVTQLNRVTRGWMSAYAFCNIPSELIVQIDHVVGTCLASWMKYYGLLKSENALTQEKRERVGLWSVSLAKIDPLLTSAKPAKPKGA